MYGSRRARRSHLALHQLETRDTPNGTVNAVQVGSTLTLTGDDDNNAIEITQSAAGITVVGVGNTTVTGGPLFTGVTALKTAMADGNDNISLGITSDLVLSGAATFDLGDGDNTLQLLTIGKIGFSALSIIAGDGKDTITVAGGFGMGSQITGNATILLGIGRGDQDDPLGTRTHVSVRAMDILGLGGLRISALDGNEELVLQGLKVRAAVNINGGEGATEVTSIGGEYGSLLMTSVGFAAGGPFPGINSITDGTSVTGAVSLRSRYGISMDWNNTTTGPISVDAGPFGFVVADFNGTSAVHGNLTVRGDHLSIGPDDGATLTIDGDLVANSTGHVALSNSAAILSARNITLTGVSGADYYAFDNTASSRLNVTGAMTLRGDLVQWGQYGGETTIGTRLALFGGSEADFRTGVGFIFNAAPAKTTAASFLMQARRAFFNQTESVAIFAGGLSVLGSEEAVFESIPRFQSEDPANPGVYDSAAGGTTTVAQGNLLIQSRGFAGYFQDEGVATYGGLSVLGGGATVETDPGDGFNSVGAKLSVTSRPALIQGSAGEYHQDGGESTFAAGLSVLGRAGESQFRTDTGETHDPDFNFFDLPAKFTVTNGPLRVNAGPGDVMFSAGGESLNVGGDVSISGAGFNRIWILSEAGATINGSLKVAGATGDPDWFLVWDSLTVSKDLSVNLGGGANAYEFGTNGGTTTVGGNLTLTGLNGSDEITLNSVTVTGATTINTAAAADTLTINDSTFNGLVTVDFGGGADTLNVANAAGWAGPVTFNAKATVRMGIGNDTLALGLALLSGGDLNSRVAFAPVGNLSVDGGLNLNLFDDEAGQFDASKVTTLNFTDPTP